MLRQQKLEVENVTLRPRLTTFVALGKVAHDSLCRSFEMPLARAKFAHGAEHELPADQMLLNSYHCSRYNTQTRRLTADIPRDEATPESIMRAATQSLEMAR